MQQRRSDLAMESRQLWTEANGKLEGVTEERTVLEGFPVTTVRVETEEAAGRLCKPVGVYTTEELGRFLRREDDAFSSGARAIAGALRELLPPHPGSVLVVG